MLRSVDELIGYTIRAVDDEMGSVDDFYFDDEKWGIRYLVVDTGGWLPGRRVLLAPVVLGQPDWKDRNFPVELSTEQVEKSPGIDADQPVSRQHEADLHAYYGWPVYWGLEPFPGVVPVPEAESEPEEKEEGDPHLRSVREVMGYHIQAHDGEIGHVEDFIVDDQAWVIRYVVVDTRNWLPGKKVLVSPQWVDRVDWAGAKVGVDLARERIRNSPGYDPSEPVNRAYEEKLYDYYGRPKYWV